MSARIEFTFKGLPELQRNLRKMGVNSRRALGEALFRVGNEIMKVSKRDYVPVDLGTLRASGKVDKPVYQGNNISVRLSYGGAAKAYALAVHEHPSQHSPYSWRNSRFGVRFSPAGHGPKYLELPVKKLGYNMPSRIYNELVKML